MSDALLINLSPHIDDCCICGVEVVDGHLMIPMYEGEPVPHDYQGKWAGFCACQTCFDKYEAKQ